MSESIWTNQASDNLSAEWEIGPHSRCIIDVGLDGATPGTTAGSNFGGGNVFLVRGWATGGPYYIVRKITEADSLEIRTGKKRAFCKLRLQGATSPDLSAQQSVEPRQA